MTLIEIILCVLAAATLVPVSVLLVQVLAAMPASQPREISGVRRPVLAVVVPAHNEALVIADTMRAVIPQLAAGDRLLVVADNCTDDTARIARAGGAQVLERSDRERRGKGYALDFAVRSLEERPPEIVLIVDADCHVDDGAIERLARACQRTGRAVQALYIMRSPHAAGLKTRIAEFAWLVKNQVRAVGFHRLRLPCQLMGTGMAFPWAQISTAVLASGQIVEDLQLGIDLARAGTPPTFCPEARVTSYFPLTAEGISGQRARWEHGHLGVILATAPALFVQAIRRRDRNLFAIALDLCVPPLALLLLLVVALCAVTTIFFLTTRLPLPLWLAATSLAMLGVSVFLSWARYGRSVISLASLAYAPVYALWKIPLYLRFLVARQVEWVRSKRDER